MNQNNSQLIRFNISYPAKLDLVQSVESMNTFLFSLESACNSMFESYMKKLQRNELEYFQAKANSLRMFPNQEPLFPTINIPNPLVLQEEMHRMMREQQQQQFIYQENSQLQEKRQQQQQIQVQEGDEQKIEKKIHPIIKIEQPQANQLIPQMFEVRIATSPIGSQISTSPNSPNIDRRAIVKPQENQSEDLTATTLKDNQSYKKQKRNLFNIGEILMLLEEWKKLQREKRLKREEAAQYLGVNTKTLDHYNLFFNKAKKQNYDFEQNQNQQIQHLLKFVKQTAPAQEEEAPKMQKAPESIESIEA